MEFIKDCISILQESLPGVTLEVRMDSAFFNEEIVKMLELMNVEFSISVPFERFTELKGMIEGRRRWRKLDTTG